MDQALDLQIQVSHEPYGQLLDTLFIMRTSQQFNQNQH